MCNKIQGFAMTMIILIVSSLLLSGCATTAKYQKMVSSWEGKSVAKLIDAWGYPNNIIKSPHNNNVYVYDQKDEYSYPGYCTIGGCNPTTSITNCTTWFEISKDKTIKNVSFRGDGCVYK